MMTKEDEFTTKLLSWFTTNRRNFPWREEIDPYRILVAEKLLQQTTYGHVLKVYDVFFNKFPDIHSLSQAEVSEIENTIRRLGFQRQRAQQFKRIGLAIVNKHNGEIPSSKEDLNKLDGIGDYISSAVLCFAFNKDESIVDMNVRRVVRRYFGWEKIKDKTIKKRLSKLIPKGKARQLNWALIDFSGLICSRNPKCNSCFLNNLCLYYQN